MNRNRNIQFNIRLTEKELAAFEKKRAASGLGKTDFIMRLVGSSTIKVYHFNNEVKAIMHELRRIGVNMNQVAYLVNIMQDGQALKELHHMQDSFCMAMNRLSKFLDKPLVEG